MPIGFQGRSNFGGFNANGGFFTAPWSWVTSTDVDKAHSVDSLAFS